MSDRAGFIAGRDLPRGTRVFRFCESSISGAAPDPDAMFAGNGYRFAKWQGKPNSATA
jgi:hypothetical protein